MTKDPNNLGLTINDGVDPARGVITRKAARDKATYGKPVRNDDDMDVDDLYRVFQKTRKGTRLMQRRSGRR